MVCLGCLGRGTWVLLSVLGTNNGLDHLHWLRQPVGVDSESDVGVDARSEVDRRGCLRVPHRRRRLIKQTGYRCPL